MNRYSAYRALFTVLFVLGTCVPQPAFAASALTAIWANTGEDKVTQDELRATSGALVRNTVWDGSRITLFGGRNEVVSFNLILEAGGAAASNVTVTFDELSGPSGARIASTAATGNGVFNWVNRPIELFYVRYLQIKGIGRLVYEAYDERHIPKKLQRPHSNDGRGSGGWSDRPGHDKFFPDIAVPLEAQPTFTVGAGKNQSIWADIYIPKSSPAGNYVGNVVVRQNGAVAGSIPVQLRVYAFTLPDTPSAKTMLYYSPENVNHRYLGSTTVTGSAAAQAVVLRDRHYQLAHRHKISLIGDPVGSCGVSADEPCPESLPRLNGSLFTSAKGYDGPGVNTSNGVYSIGTYGQWSWRSGNEANMHQHTNAWADWFSSNAPGVEYFLYLIDESTDYAQTQRWASWILSNPASGRNVKSMATLPVTHALTDVPSLDIPTSSMKVGIASQWELAAASYISHPRKRLYMYNGGRPASGTNATEDDGVAMRQIAWAQFKKHVHRWFMWESTYYNNFQGGMGETNVMQTAMTFGTNSANDSVFGRTGWNYSNGDGVLIYPGTDRLFPSDSYGLEGPIASLRMKHWRRGIQDADYLTMAAAVNSGATQAIVNQIVPKVLWEYGVDSNSDPTYVRSDISWSVNPDVWEAARAQLAAIITGQPVSITPVTGSLPAPTLNLPSSLPVNAEITAGYPSGYAIASYQWSFVPVSASAQSSGFRSPGAAAGSFFFTPGATAQLASMNLSPGMYQIAVVAIDSTNQISPAAQATVSLVGGDARSVTVYPNPWRADLAYPQQVTFGGLIEGSTVKIFTVSGHWVGTITSSGATASWDLRNNAGDHAASGIYMFVVNSPDGQKTRGRLVIIR